MSRTIKAGLLAHLTFGSLPIPSGTVTIGLPMSIEAYSCGYSSGIESVSLTGFPIRTSPCETGRSPLPKTKVTFFRIKPKATERFRLPLRSTTGIFSPVPCPKTKPAARPATLPIPSRVARSADDGIFQPRIIRRCLFSLDRPSAAVCRKNTNGEAPQAVRISRRSCPFAGNIKTVHHRSVKPDFSAFMGRARFSGNRQPANSSVPAIFDRPSPYRRVAMARPFKTTFPTRRPFTMNAPPPCLHRKKPSRKRIACFPSTVSFPPERAPPAAAALRPFAGTSRNKTGGRPFSPTAPSAG